ncbi:hypothetical protein FRC02_011396 [Tulasnella sp. 418]|nr:hypothetical protein FRC02_011396 [Tulasnella sp. 418]
MEASYDVKVRRNRVVCQSGIDVISVFGFIFGMYRARHRLNECLAAEGSFILPPDDPRVEQVKRVSERIIAAIEEDQNQPSHIVSAAQWPSTLSASLYEETLRTFDHDPHRVRGPSAIATSALLPHRLESSNPNKIFGDQDWKIYVVDLPRINAFALPTKEIFVYTGIIDLLEDDSMLSGVLAHEIAHVQQRHAVENAGVCSFHVQHVHDPILTSS